MGLAAAEEGIAITEFRQEKVVLFDATGAARLDKRAASSIALPLPVIDTLPSGHYVIEIAEQRYSVKKSTVRTNRVYELSSRCNNAVAAHKTGVTRGLGNGECE